MERARIPEAARKLFDGLSNCDIDEVAEGLCEDARLSLSSRSYATGKSRVRRMLLEALGSVYSIRCEPVVVWVEGNLAIVEADVVCERQDRTRVTFPATVVLRFEGGLISDIRLSTYEPAVIGNFGAFTPLTA